jgi:type III restriction enzyme
MNLHLKDYQETAINELSLSFLNLWNTKQYKIPIIFKAPTGAGKTIMMAEFLRCLDDNYQFHEDKAYIWISFGGDESYTQSKNKLYQYFNEGTDMNLKDINNLSEGKLYKNNIFFINWAKIKTSDKEGKKLRKPNEHTDGDFGIFDEFIMKTKNEREIVLIIDEADREAGERLTLYNEIIDLIVPRIIIKVSATPDEETKIKALAFDKKAGFVEVLEDDVINSGIIKEKIIIQTEEEIKSLEKEGLSEDFIMLELAINKRNELKSYYESLEKNINPLVLIQLPSDEKEKEDVTANKKDIVLSYLKQKGIKDNEIAIWLSNEKKNLELIEKNNNEVNFMLFKVAPARGWDCPRAEVLVMFREIGTPSFHTQIIGRIKRMPEGHHYNISQLNYAYIYTNYNKNHIKDIKEETSSNKPPIFYTKCKDEITKIKLNSIFHKRTDYNTLTPPPLWQSTFLESFDKYFQTKISTLDFTENFSAVMNKIEMNVENIPIQIIVNTEIMSFDNFVNEIKLKGSNLEYHFSESDIERYYNLLCYNELNNQVNELAKYNPSRSWGQLKQALNVWFDTRFKLDREKWYKVIVNDLLKTESHLKKAINKSLIDFREKYEIKIKENDKKEELEVLLPPDEVSYTDDYSEIVNSDLSNIFDGNSEITHINKNVYNKFYLKKVYNGRINELKFINYLENQENVEWWHKQPDSGRDVFAIEYLDSQEKKSRLFYPDFIIKTTKNLYILDTKSGITARTSETKDKAEALQKWIKNNQDKYNFNIIGGIVNWEYPNWQINKKESYVYESDKDWEVLNFNE